MGPGIGCLGLLADVPGSQPDAGDWDSSFPVGQPPHPEPRDQGTLVVNVIAQKIGIHFNSI